MTNNKTKFMLTITQDFLDACPNWQQAGWNVGDEVDLTLLPTPVINAIDQHPIHKPGG